LPQNPGVDAHLPGRRKERLTTLRNVVAYVCRFPCKQARHQCSVIASEARRRRAAGGWPSSIGATNAANLPLPIAVRKNYRSQSAAWTQCCFMLAPDRAHPLFGDRQDQQQEELR